jgi:hypothetical protein
MPKHYRKLTEIEKALRFIKERGWAPVQLQYLFGGDASEWGRLLIGQHQPHGEYLGFCKEINNHGSDVLFALQVAARKGYNKKTRKGKIVPRTKDVFGDLEYFRIDQIVEKESRNVFFEDYYDAQEYYYRETEYIFQNGPMAPQSYEDEQNTRKEFLNSLDDIVV